VSIGGFWFSCTLRAGGRRASGARPAPARMRPTLLRARRSHRRHGRDTDCELVLRSSLTTAAHAGACRGDFERAFRLKAFARPLLSCWTVGRGARELDGRQHVGRPVKVQVEARRSVVRHEARAGVRDRVAERDLAVDERGRRDRRLEQRQQVVVGLGRRQLEYAVDPVLGDRALAPARRPRQVVRRGRARSGPRGSPLRPSTGRRL